MPTLPLLDEDNAQGDGWHRVRSPGGYEGWHFYAEDPTAKIRLVADFFEGNPFDAEYLHRYRAYRARPRRNRPPTPADYPAVRFAIYEGDKCLWQGDSSYAPSEFKATGDRLRVHLGPNRVEPEKSGWRLHIESEARADLFFAPVWIGQSLPMKSNGDRWLIPAPLCDVTGQIRLRDRTIDFSGRGAHEHRYSTTPPAANMSTWLRCQILDPAFAAFLELAVASAQVDGQMCRGAIFYSGQSSALVDLPTVVEWKSHTGFGRAYPSSVNLGNRLALCNARELRRTRSELTLLYDAFVDGQAASALAQVTNFDSY